MKGAIRELHGEQEADHPHERRIVSWPRALTAGEERDGREGRAAEVCEGRCRSLGFAGIVLAVLAVVARVGCRLRRAAVLDQRGHVPGLDGLTRHVVQGRSHHVEVLVVRELAQHKRRPGLAREVHAKVVPARAEGIDRVAKPAVVSLGAHDVGRGELDRGRDRVLRCSWRRRAVCIAWLWRQHEA
jgi:hypothetical protein